MQIVILYTSVGCHLCEQALAVVRPLLPQFGLTLREVEIADSEALMACYGARIPVLRLERISAELGWPFDARDVVHYLESSL